MAYGFEVFDHILKVHGDNLGRCLLENVDEGYTSPVCEESVEVSVSKRVKCWLMLTCANQGRRGTARENP